MFVQFCPVVQKFLRAILTRPWAGNKTRVKLSLVQNCHSCKNDPSCKSVCVQNCLLVLKYPLVQK